VKTEEITFRNTFSTDKHPCFLAEKSGNKFSPIWPLFATICPLLATIRDCLPLFALFETIRTICTIRYSRLFATRVLQTTPLATLPLNSCCRYFHNLSEKHLQFSGNYWETLKSTEIKRIWSSCLYDLSWNKIIPNDWSGKNIGTQISNDGCTV